MKFRSWSVHRKFCIKAERGSVSCRTTVPLEEPLLTFMGESVVDSINCLWLPFSAPPAILVVIILPLLPDMFHRWVDNSMCIIIFTQSMITDRNAITSRPPTANTLVARSVHTIPETLFYSKIILGATVLISRFPSGIQAKRYGKNVVEATKWNIMHFKAVMSHRFRHTPNLLIQCYNDACVLQCTLKH